MPVVKPMAPVRASISRFLVLIAQAGCFRGPIGLRSALSVLVVLLLPVSARGRGGSMAHTTRCNLRIVHLQHAVCHVVPRLRRILTTLIALVRRRRVGALSSGLVGWPSAGRLRSAALWSKGA